PHGTTGHARRGRRSDSLPGVAAFRLCVGSGRRSHGRSLSHSVAVLHRIIHERATEGRKGSLCGTVAEQRYSGQEPVLPLRVMGWSRGSRGWAETRRRVVPPYRPCRRWKDWLCLPDPSFPAFLTARTSSPECREI